MKLTVIGCSGSVSGPDSAASSYLIQAEEAGKITSVVLDLGSGAFGQLMRFVDPGTLDAVFLSHLHADHVVDATSLEVHLKYAPTGPYPPMRVFGPEGTEERLRDLNGYCSQPPDNAPFPFDVQHWHEGQTYHVGPLTIEVFEVEHSVLGYAMRITGPSETGNETKIITYSGDTDSCDGLVEAARDSDLFLCEAAFEEDRDRVRGIHLTGRRAGQAATEAEVRRLALTHIPPWTSKSTIRAEACTEYTGPVDVAEPGVTWSL